MSAQEHHIGRAVVRDEGERLRVVVPQSKGWGKGGWFAHLIYLLPFLLFLGYGTSATLLRIVVSGAINPTNLFGLLLFASMFFLSTMRGLYLAYAAFGQEEIEVDSTVLTIMRRVGALSARRGFRLTAIRNLEAPLEITNGRYILGDNPPSHPGLQFKYEGRTKRCCTELNVKEAREVLSLLVNRFPQLEVPVDSSAKQQSTNEHFFVESEIEDVGPSIRITVRQRTSKASRIALYCVSAVFFAALVFLAGNAIQGLATLTLGKPLSWLLWIPPLDGLNPPAKGTTPFNLFFVLIAIAFNVFIQMYGLSRRFGGTETVELDASSLWRGTQFLWRNRVQNYEAARIKKLRLYESYKTGLPCGLAFDYDGKTVHCALGMSETDSRRALKAIAAKFPHLVQDPASPTQTV